MNNGGSGEHSLRNWPLSWALRRVNWQNHLCRSEEVGGMGGRSEYSGRNHIFNHSKTESVLLISLLAPKIKIYTFVGTYKDMNNIQSLWCSYYRKHIQTLYHVSGSALTPLHVFSLFLLTQPCDTGVTIIPILQVRKLRHSVSDRAEIQTKRGWCESLNSSLPWRET